MSFATKLLKQLNSCLVLLSRFQRFPFSILNFFPRQVVDFPASLEKGSFCAKPCVSVELDELRRRLHGLPDLLQVVAEEEKERLPKEVGACVVSYIPHVGYLVAMPIKRALQEQGFDYHNIPGYHFMFENLSLIHI